MKAKAKAMLKIRNQYYQPGVEVPGDVAEKLVAAGLAIETAATTAPENAMMPKAKLKHLGGGYYEVRGQKVRGKKKAQEMMEE